MQIKNAILNALNLEKGEEKLVFLPVLFSFFSGAALAFFVTGATSLFLSHYERKDLPLVFIVGALIVLAAGKLVAIIQKKRNFSSILSILSLFLAISVLILVLLYFFTNLAIFLFILYAWIRIFAYVQGVTFWGIAGRLFNIQQAKRIFGLITSGEVIASIISFFSVPILLKFMATEYLLFISVCTSIISLIIVFIIIKKYKNKLNNISKKENSNTLNKEEISKENSKKKYLNLFIIVAFLPAFAQFFIDFIFQAQAKIEFLEKDQLTNFIGLFFGVSSIIELLIKTTVAGKLMNKYGVKFGLLSFPIVLGISLLIASIVGVLYGPTGLFFSFITLGRLFTRAIRTSINDPATQILYQPLPPNERILFQNKIESGPKAWAGLIAGVILLIFSYINGFTLVHFSLILLVAIIIWLKSSFDIYKEYKKMLHSALDYFTKKNYISKSKEIEDYISEKIILYQQNIKSSYNGFIRKLLPYSPLFKSEFKNINQTNIEDLVSSQNSFDRINAVQYLSSSIKYSSISHIIRLLNDENYFVKTEAIFAAGKIGKLEILPYLLSLFETQEFREPAFKAICNFNESILPEMNKFFYKWEDNIEIQLQTIEVFSCFDNNYSLKFLRKLLNYPNFVIKDKVTKLLSEKQYIATGLEAPIFSEMLEKLLYQYFHNACAQLDIENLKNNEELLEILKFEKQKIKDKVFSVLTIIYDSKAISLIKDNFESEDADAGGFALEIADTVIDPKHKGLIIPFFKTDTNEKIVFELKEYFSVNKLSYKERLRDIILAEYTMFGTLAKIESLKLLSYFKDENIFDLLKTYLLHPNIFIRETAAEILHEKNSDIFYEQIVKFRKYIKNVDQLISNIQISGTKTKLPVIEKLLLLKNLAIFSDLPPEQLLVLTTNSEEISLNENQEFVFTNDEFAVIIFGSFIRKNKTDLIFDELLIDDSNLMNVFISKEKSFIIKSKSNYLLNLISNNYEFTKKFFKNYELHIN